MFHKTANFPKTANVPENSECSRKLQMPQKTADVWKKAMISRKNKVCLSFLVKSEGRSTQEITYGSYEVVFKVSQFKGQKHSHKYFLEK